MGAFRKGYKSAWWSPVSLTYPSAEPRTIEKRYKAWLIGTGRVKAEGAALDRAASNYIEAQRLQGKDTATNGGEVKTYQRKEILFGGGIVVRVVPCFTQASGRYQDDVLYLEGGVAWGHTGGSGVTTYWVMVAGRMVDSYLSQSRAVKAARTLSEQMPFDERYPLEKRA